VQILIRIFSAVKRYPGMACLSLFLSLIIASLVLVAPIMTERFMGEIIPNNRKDLVLPMTLLAVILVVVRQVLVMWNTVLSTSLEQKLIHELRQKLYRKVQRMPLPFFDKKNTGDIMSRINGDVPAMEAVIVQGISQGLGGIIQVAVVLTYMLSQHIGLTLVTLAPIPIVGLITWLYSKYGEPRYHEESKANAHLSNQLHDNLAGIRQIKVYTVEEEKLNDFTEKSEEVLDTQMRVVRANAITWPSVSMIAESGLLAMLGAGAYWVLVENISLEVMFAFFAAWGYFYEPFSRIGPLSKTFAKAHASGRRVYEVLDDDEEVNLKSGLEPDLVEYSISFEEVTFGYNKKEKATVQNINLAIQTGKTVAFVGETGAGKSTLFNLLTGFYHPWEGKILIGGTDVSKISKAWLREQIGYVTQENFLFNVSVRENLQLANPGASEDDLWKALSSANAADFVRNLPNGIDSLTGERGNKLSGGEKQRLSIARALLKNPPVLLLDEATSAVDNETERLIQESLDTLKKDRTCLVIAHRLSTVKSADLIIVMHDGKIAESGTHKNLLIQKESYASLQI